MKVWHRLCVDLDATGGPVGVSVEAHTEDGPVRMSTEACGPFDTLDDAIGQVVELHRAMLPLTLF